MTMLDYDLNIKARHEEGINIKLVGSFIICFNPNSDVVALIL